MKAENMIGNHPMELGTVEELYDLLKQMTPATRRDSYLRVEAGDNLYDFLGVGIAQSDQAESHVLKVTLKAVAR